MKFFLKFKLMYSHLQNPNPMSISFGRDRETPIIQKKFGLLRI